MPGPIVWVQRPLSKAPVPWVDRPWPQPLLSYVIKSKQTRQVHSIVAVHDPITKEGEHNPPSAVFAEGCHHLSSPGWIRPGVSRPLLASPHSDSPTPIRLLSLHSRAVRFSAAAKPNGTVENKWNDTQTIGLCRRGRQAIGSSKWFASHSKLCGK